MPHDSQNEDILLAKGCSRNDSRCQKALFDKYYGKMLAVCLRYTHNREDARDVLQEGFVKVFKHIGDFQYKSSLETWMKKIMVNTSIDRYRKDVSQPFIDDIENKSWELQSEDEELLQQQEIINCLQMLPPGYRLIINLHAIEGYSHKEIAVMLNITAGTSKSQLSKARICLKNIMTKLMST